ncbi:MAG: glycosyltransferase family 4 protein [Candidatus Promineifilaceae bacterium]
MIDSKMKILFLTQIIPYPPDAGPRVKTWHVLRYLIERGHEVTLASFVRPDEVRHVPVLAELCHAVHTVPIHRSRLADVGYWLRSQVTRRPFLIERDDLPGMRQLVRRLLAETPFDIVHADQLTMTQFALDALNVGGKRPYTIFDAHNATWTISARMVENMPWFLKPVVKLETARIQKYEAMLVEQLDHTMVVIEPDRKALLAGAGNGRAARLTEKISVIPIAVDTNVLQPVKRRSTSRNILTLGSLNYPPNADGIRWFVQDVFPLIRQEAPDVTLTVIGKNPPADFVRWAEQEPAVFDVTGYVEDLTPCMEKAALMVVPVRAGSGMRVRLLEAFARSMPTVTTTIGLEGIEAESGREVLVADTPEEFARAVLHLLHNPALQSHLAEHGRLLAQKKYDWRVVLAKMDAVYQKARQP